MVYVMGDVARPGAFVLSNSEAISVLQALAMAHGLNRTADTKGAKIIRTNAGENRVEVAVNLKDILNGKTPDMQMKPHDILFVPNSYAKSTLLRTVETAIQIGTGVMIYR
jgi:polysaccharide export outer membrane protein